jgi:polyhydroxyalkanoate synthesis regulator phasin
MDNAKKAFLLGLGITLLTKEAVEREVHQYMKKYNISEEQSKKVAAAILADSLKHKRDIEGKIKTVEAKVIRHAKGLSQETPKKKKKK